MTDPRATPATLAPDPDDEPTARERAAAVLEDRFDIPMAVLAGAWGALVAYELVAPARQRDVLTLISHVIWVVFVLELAVKLWVSGHPLRFLRRRWPSLLFLALPLLRILRLIRAVRALRALPVMRVVGSGYRTIGSARSLLGGRLTYLALVTATVVFAGGQLLYLLETEGGSDRTLGNALWWAANLVISSSYTFEPSSVPSRLVSLILSAYSIVVFASVAAALGAFFLESRSEAEQASADADSRGDT
ncbi:MAG TPA: ion transporter [Acidimicrobiales bacterium]|nr:ion transporter [Acidimicrobiales bacterium]